MDIRFFIGPMSKNVVDSIIEYQDFSSKKVGIIPSRRQVDYLGGYSNNWTTDQISKYSDDLIIMRDHSGHGQGAEEDDGYLSLEHECKYFDYIHIDTWKKNPSFNTGYIWNLDILKFCL